MTRDEHIVIRRAAATDDMALATLAVIDGGRARLDGDVLVAEAGGRVRAALGSNGVAISDPFWPSAELVNILRVHAGAADHTRRRGARFALRRPALA